LIIDPTPPDFVPFRADSQISDRAEELSLRQEVHRFSTSVRPVRDRHLPVLQRRHLGLVLGAALVLALSACGRSGEPADGGPLAQTEQPSVRCLPVAPGDTGMFQVAEFSNPSSASIDIVDVSMQTADDLSVAGFLLVRNTGDEGQRSTIGAVRGFPPNPADVATLTQDWAAAAPAAGAAIASGETVDLVVGLRADPGSGAGKASGVHLTYRVGDQGYRTTIDVAYVLPGGGGC
jgi:hypothetical protein